MSILNACLMMRSEVHLRVDPFQCFERLELGSWCVERPWRYPFDWSSWQHSVLEGSSARSSGVLELA